MVIIKNIIHVTFLYFRNLFSKRTKELKSVVHSAPGWKLFGKVPPRENLQKTSKIIQQVSTNIAMCFVLVFQIYFLDN